MKRAIVQAAEPSFERLSFSGHETFPFRYGWPVKCVQGVLADSGLFQKEDAIVRLGVGRNMVTAIRHWGDALGLIESGSDGRSNATELGRTLFDKDGWDPYMEDPATLWLLHWRLVSRRDRASAWYLIFTCFNHDQFRAGTLLTWIKEYIQDNPTVRATTPSLKRDIDVFIRTYVASRVAKLGPVEDTFDCPLVELGLMERTEGDEYAFLRGPRPSLPDAVLVYAIHQYWNSTAESQNTVQFETLAHKPGSPGAAFKMSERALAERLESLPKWARLTWDDSSGSRMIVRSKPIGHAQELELLGHHFQAAKKERGERRG